MRPVSGFERPLVQWLFVALGIVLIVVAGAEAVRLRRAREQVTTLLEADFKARLERDRLTSHVAREQAAREALALEISRARGGVPAIQPTLTLSPVGTKGATPPEPTVDRVAPTRVIELRLILPRRAPRGANYAVAIRSWSGGQTIWTRTGLPATAVEGTPMVAAFVTGDVFAPGAYEVTLTAAPGGEIASYEVSVGRSVSNRR